MAAWEAVYLNPTAMVITETLMTHTAMVAPAAHTKAHTKAQAANHFYCTEGPLTTPVTSRRIMSMATITRLGVTTK
ncbi:hypothetical protein FB645_005070 [Coemansia sp. IMI 203386]|nr:hypothetical protein FB645_005070 [Coemansia sp. IMI 203386]